MEPATSERGAQSLTKLTLVDNLQAPLFFLHTQGYLIQTNWPLCNAFETIPRTQPRVTLFLNHL